MKPHRPSWARPAADVARVALVALALSAAPSVARAYSPPDPPLDVIRNILVCPDGSLTYQITHVAIWGPVPNALVELRYTPAGDAAACWCPSQVHPVISAVTNENGVATFHIAGGLCLDPSIFPGGVVAEVWIDGIKEKEVGQVSPQVVPTSDCQVTLGSAVTFTPYLSTGQYGFCYDLNHDNAVGLSDGILFTAAAANAAACH